MGISTNTLGLYKSDLAHDASEKNKKFSFKRDLDDNWDVIDKYLQVTNCILETPNNLIWEEITNGVRLKAGSIITIPDGKTDSRPYHKR